MKNPFSRHQILHIWDIFKSKTWLKSPVFWTRFAAYALPTILFFWVIYWNYSPFGYTKTYTIEVGSKNDTSGAFKLEESEYLGERQTNENGDTFRTLGGVVYTVFKPEAVLRDTRLIYEIKGAGATIMPFSITDDYSKYKWNYFWDFGKGTLPKGLEGNAKMTNECAEFNGTDQTLELPNSKDMFESEAFSVYAKWRPDNSTFSNQQIIGHYNWELWQKKDSVEFRIGRMDNKDGKFHTIKFPISNPEEFFGYTHTALAIYNPSPTGGYIDLYIDEYYVGRTYFGASTIWNDYNGDRNITLGKSGHGSAQYFDGCIYQAGIQNGLSVKPSQKTSFRLSGPEEVILPIISTSLTNLYTITLHVQK